MDAARTAIFVFPQASGHINPSLPICRALVARGWAVEYLCTTQFREEIEHTGATFLDRDALFKEHGIDDVTAVVMGTFAEYGEGAKTWALNFGSIATQRLLPVYIDWLRARRPHLVVYCPVLCAVAHFASMKLNIPDVSLLTAAGPGFFDAAIASAYGAAAVRGAAAGLVQSIASNEANAVAREAICAELGVQLALNSTEPLIADYYTSLNIVTTTQELADPICTADAEHYAASGKRFEYVGPLLDVTGAKRAAGTLQAAGTSGETKAGGLDDAEVMRAAEQAVRDGREVIYVSMGTVITGDDAQYGWEADCGSALTGRQLCQAVYRAVFEQLGEDDTAEHSRFIVVSLGPQQHALEGLRVPANALCVKRTPQVDLLRASKPALFITNGGQNSLMESLAVGTPVVVCPGFGDQVSNAAKVERQGWGMSVSRPPKVSTEDGGASAGDVNSIVDGFCESVRSAVMHVLGSASFRSRAQELSDSLSQARGVNGAVQLLEEAATNGRMEPSGV